MSGRRCRVLFVDDSSDDHALFRSALRRAPASIEILTPLHDGTQAMAYLSGSGEFADRETYPLPDLLVLDLKMPRKSGHELLAWLQTYSFRPVTVVFSGSDQDKDVSRANALGARHYFVKPVDWPEWIRVVNAICEHCPKRLPNLRHGVEQVVHT